MLGKGQWWMIFKGYARSGPIGRHFSWDATMHKILRDGYYYPTLFKDKPESYQLCTTKEKKASITL